MLRLLGFSHLPTLGSQLQYELLGFPSDTSFSSVQCKGVSLAINAGDYIPVCCSSIVEKSALNLLLKHLFAIKHSLNWPAEYG